jgi:hypothetical protein
MFTGPTERQEFAEKHADRIISDLVKTDLTISESVTKTGDLLPIDVATLRRILVLTYCVGCDAQVQSYAERVKRGMSNL